MSDQFHISERQKEEAALLLLDQISQTEMEQISGLIHHHTDDWWQEQHLSLGLKIRNLLRSGGFSWDDATFDDWWMKITEHAAHLADNLKPISKEQARDIAMGVVGAPNIRSLNVHDQCPENCRVYGLPKQDCWCVMAAEGPANILKSSRLICVSKLTGRVLFDGSAKDEG